MTAPIEDIDDVAVERACGGDRSVTLNRAETAVAVRTLLDGGFSLDQTAERLGITSRTVSRVKGGDTALPYSRQGTSQDRTSDRVKAAAKSRVPAVRRAAAKAEQALANLDRALAESNVKEQALERIAELEKELADAKAALRPGKAKTAPAKGLASQARAWAKNQGIEVPARGRVPSDIVAAFEQATEVAA